MVENEALRDIPFAVQQKQIIVTCNYEARRRGLRKLQLITEARQICPDVVIVLGENLEPFRNASKALYHFLETFTWSGKVERLGFDEVFMDVTDIIDYNQTLLNPYDLSHSFFQLRRDDPTSGFAFDATEIAGHGYPHKSSSDLPSVVGPELHDPLSIRLLLGSHFARHLRLSLEEEKGYTSTVGISTNKLLSKLVGNMNKPKGQTTLLPPYTVEVSNSTGASGSEIRSDTPESNVTTFIDGHDIGKIPGIGFKISQRIRNHVLSRPADFERGLVYGETKESVSVRDVRLFPGISANTLEMLLGGSGAEHGIGGKVWGLINGIDNTPVKDARKLPNQISIEDSYIRLDSMPQVMRELRKLGTSLVDRMHTDLLEDDDDDKSGSAKKRWMAHPKTIRLSTRPRPPVNSDGTRTRTFNRISKSCPLPNFALNLKDRNDSVVERLVQQTLLPMFRRLHPQQAGWNLSLMNICVTNMAETASEDGGGGGRDIGRMFKRQEIVLKDWKIEDKDVPPDPWPVLNVPDLGTRSVEGYLVTEPSAGCEVINGQSNGSEDFLAPSQGSTGSVRWESDENEEDRTERCKQCGMVMPAFAVAAHERFHVLED
ncbi:DNA polymerase [Coleophoma crateriformis]|uniref:DNA polymerase n=1 Tax=Coleophoma crateriformis TaxID=565419 RepID=A0A3D8RN98_9HELO|nr:DNA polymerase [Coleophoma crateriformis]